ncbi:MAG: hypothetical protein ACOX69_01285 [Coriobacteriales bacterium]|jgi:hypothetical protein
MSEDGKEKHAQAAEKRAPGKLSKVLPAIVAVICVLAVLYGLTAAGYLSSSYETTPAATQEKFVSKDEFDDELAKVETVIQELSGPPFQSESSKNLTRTERKHLKNDLLNLVKKYQQKETGMAGDDDYSRLDADFNSELNDIYGRYSFTPSTGATELTQP